jgi:hypothetical protein
VSSREVDAHLVAALQSEERISALLEAKRSMYGEDPQWRLVCRDRDARMAAALWEAAASVCPQEVAAGAEPPPPQAATVVGVVGFSHVPGIRYGV